MSLRVDRIVLARIRPGHSTCDFLWTQWHWDDSNAGSYLFPPVRIVLPALHTHISITSHERYINLTASLKNTTTPAPSLARFFSITGITVTYWVSCVISGFCPGLWCHVTWVGSYRRFGTTYRPKQCKKIVWPLNVGPIGCLSKRR
jgi:hypothetical protein